MNPPASSAAALPKPLWLLAELTYRCPLQCPYCSNPIDFAKQKSELDTDEWLKVLREARAMGATQLGFSGGEPLVRRDLEVLVAEARKLGYYTNLITSGIGMDEARITALKAAGIDHIQLSFQASTRELNDRLAGITAFDHKLAVARMIKAHGFPMVLCFVIHRQNIDSLAAMIELAGELGADYVELASTQYYGWARTNRDQLLPSRDQVRRAEAVAHDYQERFKGRMKIFYVVTDYYEERPKACMNGWGNVFLAVSPDGTALPCHSARQLPGLDFPNVRTSSIAAIWNDSAAFNAFRGDAWMKEPCRSCPEKAKDFGGCRCQAYMLTGDAANADPVCSLSPHHQIVLDAGARITTPAADLPLRMRNVKNSLTSEPTV